MLRIRRPPSSAGVEADIHVTVPSEAGRRRRHSIVVHRSRTVDSDQIALRLGIPVTTPSRTLKDLRRALPQSQFAAALRQAEFLGLPISEDLAADRTRSELERVSLPSAGATAFPSRM